LSQKFALAVAASCLALGVSGCSGFKDAIGANKQSPDEFAVQTRAPLAVPADFSLKPPQPGAPRPQDAEASARAQQTLSGTAPPRPATDAENALLANAGADRADPKIRNELMVEQRERKTEAARYSYADAVLFWHASPNDNGQPLDASEEAKRLKDSPMISAQTTMGDTSTAAAPTEQKPADQPVIKKDDKSGGWFSGWF